MLASALLLAATGANAAVVNPASSPFEARGRSTLGSLLAAQRGNTAQPGYVYQDGLNLGDDLGVEGKSIYVGKDDQGIQLFQFADGSVAPLTYAPGDTKDIPIKDNGVCDGCEPSAGFAKNERKKRDLPSSLGANPNSDTAGNADFGSLRIGEDVGAQVGLDGAKYVGKDQDGTQLFQFPDGDVAPIVLGAGDVVQGATYNEQTKLCDGCQNSPGSVQQRDVELAEREASQNEERTLGLLLGVLGLKVAIGKKLFFGPGHWGCKIGHGGFININGCRPGQYIGIKNCVYAGCNEKGVQLFHFPNHGVAPLKCHKGTPRPHKVDKNGYCSACHHGGWSTGGWWKKDVYDVDERSVQHEERTLGLVFKLLGLKIAIGKSLLLGCGRVQGYWAHGGYLNIPNCKPGTDIGIHGGVYVGCNKDGVQLYKWGHGGVGPLACKRGPVRQGCKVKHNICDVCHHDGNFGWSWRRDLDQLD